MLSKFSNSAYSTSSLFASASDALLFCPREMHSVCSRGRLFRRNLWDDLELPPLGHCQVFQEAQIMRGHLTTSNEPL
jgi:hypothetical protein